MKELRHTGDPGIDDSDFVKIATKGIITHYAVKENLLKKMINMHGEPGLYGRIVMGETRVIYRVKIVQYINSSLPDYEYVYLDDELIGAIGPIEYEDKQMTLKYWIKNDNI